MNGVEIKSSFLLIWGIFLGNFALRVVSNGPLGIPGTTQTISGYDTELGNDPICWSSYAAATGDVGIPFPNGELVQNFSLANEVNLASSCPSGTWLKAMAPPEFLNPNFRPRTLEWYSYTIKGAVDLDELSGLQIVSDEGSRISIGLVACDSTRAGFCSPFVHEQANIRENNEMEQHGSTLFAKKRVTGDRHGGTHVHAPAVLMDADPSLRQVQFEVQVPMIINEPGTFFVIGTLQFFMGNDEGEPRWRYDVANALTLEQGERLITYQVPAKILEVSTPVRIFSFVVVGLAASIILFLLIQLSVHYRSQVLKISQAPFLVVFLFASFLATVSSLLFDPRNNWMCLLAYPAVFTSLQLMFAVTLGRLWRINAVVSPLLRNRLQRGKSKEHVRALIPACCPSRRTNIRREINHKKVSLIVALCSLPQIVLQLLSMLLQPSEKSIEFNPDESIGRCVCDDGVKAKQSIAFYAMVVLFLLILVLLVMAHSARQLPSLLNESSVIFGVTGTSALLAILGFAVIAITDDPTISPDVSYLVHIILVLSMTLNSSIRIMMPKLKMVWSGQAVMVSQLVADHNQSLIDSARRTNPKSLMHNVTGLEMNSANSDPTSSFQKSWTRGGMSQTQPSGVSNDDATESQNQESLRQEDFTLLEDITEKQESIAEKHELLSDSSSKKSVSSQEEWIRQAEEKAENENVTTATTAKPSPGTDQVKVKLQREKRQRKKCSNGSSSSTKFLIRQGEAPSRRLTLMMLDLHDELNLITNQITSGLEVPRDKWESVRKNTEQLEEMFSLVRFDWESQTGPCEAENGNEDSE
ncbi:7 transmembrane sweet-taste receptor of 3 GCPR domain containing protein [Nitzschia inconspicua]|uniref:7 transmembrane sweet-taste receptor of 3 GCPR domain containing protein n=1 Tax=Nitzschia inconspicua TaxID=303405 RepID=A0A9K3LRV2_9STRA|nr:7 transmembrane sweet-taste receptor of 3 GCPR domain containing protein [Nitzschia inconspicua]